MSQQNDPIAADERTLADLIDQNDAAACHAWLDDTDRLDAVRELSHLSDRPAA